jgi:penicillin amidase/acyl-homoserine-lactone acylase
MKKVRGLGFWLKRGLLAFGGLVLVAAGALLIMDLPNQPHSFDSQAALSRGDAYEVRIRRDEYGVPHILGPRDADVAFGIAYAHSEDDFATIATVILATRGQLAARDGAKGAVTDYLVQLMRLWPAVNSSYDSLPADLRRVLEGYADGVNYYGAKHPDKLTPGLLPVTGRDVAAGFAFKTPFFYGLDRTLTKLLEPTKAKKALPVGSNGVAIAHIRSADGATRLLVNSHQPYTGPVAWYEAVLESGEGWHVAGGFFPGSPFMLHGHNAHLGWANTVNQPDLVDVYKLVINPANENQYRLDGQWRDFERGTATIRVKLWGPFYWTVKKQILRAAHGPVLETDHGVYAVRYAGHDEGRQALQYYRLDKARNMAEWRGAMSLQLLPSINYLYADKDGNIGYVYNGQFPVRREGVDWSGELPGDRSDLIWTSYLPFDKVPQIWNPRCGLLFNSNNTPFHATACDDDGFDPKGYSPTLGIQTNMTNRAWRAFETYGSDSKITDETFRRYKYDLTYSKRSRAFGIIRELITLDPKGDSDLVAAQKVLRQWDRRMDVHNRSAALISLITQPILSSDFNGKPVPEALDSLKAAITVLKTNYGRLDPEWGQLNRIRRGSVDLAIDGGADTYRSVWGDPQKDGTLIARAGDTLIMFVTWDKTGRLTSQSIHQFGSATLDAKSAHYADQVPLFVAMKTKPVLFTESQLAGHIRQDYTPADVH